MPCRIAFHDLGFRSSAHPVQALKLQHPSVCAAVACTSPALGGVKESVGLDRKPQGLSLQAWSGCISASVPADPGIGQTAPAPQGSAWPTGLRLCR